METTSLETATATVNVKRVKGTYVTLYSLHALTTLDPQLAASVIIVFGQYVVYSNVW